MGFRLFFRKKQRRRGFTLLETVVAAGIIAVLLGIAIPSVIYIKGSLDAKQRDNYAKSIYLSVQTQLTMMHSAGTLPELHPAGSTPHAIPRTDNAGFTGSTEGFCYITSAPSDEAIFDRMLPYGSIDETLRTQQILIEYNPVSASVVSVFYSESSDLLGYDNIARDQDTRRHLKVGYYDGTDGELGGTGNVIGSDPEPQRLVSRPELRFDNDTGTVTLTVPVPGDLTAATFLQNLSIRLSVAGDKSGAEIRNIDLKDETNPRVGEPVLSGNTCVFTYVLDSIEDPSQGFLNLGGGFIPGENVTLSAAGSYYLTNAQLGQMSVTIRDAVCHNVNPLFAACTAVTISVANARNLQNLNLFADSEKDIRTVEITQDIVWNSSLNFTPISNEMLFGSGEFYTVEDEGDPLWLDVRLDHPNREITTGATVFTDVIDTETHARVRGNNHSISGLKIADDASREFTGLFTYFNGKMDGLTVTNADVSGSGIATGILVGAAGCRADVTNCRVTSSALSASAGGESCVGGVIGYAAESSVGVNAGSLAVTVSGSSSLSSVGGLIGFADGGSVKNSSVSGTLTMNGGTAGSVGGAIGAEHNGAVFDTVSAEMNLSGWGGTAGASTPSSPSGYDVSVGKFVGSVENGVYKNCSGTGSSEGKDYQFLGSIDCVSEELELGSTGNLFRLSYPYFNVNSPDFSGYALDRFRELAEPMSETTVYISEYQATLDNCTFRDTSDRLYRQVVTGCGYYRESNTMHSVSNSTLEVGKDYILMSYDGTRIMYPSGSSGNVAPLSLDKEYPVYKTVDAIIDGSTVYLDPAMDLSPYAWEFAVEAGTRNHLNLRSVYTGEYIAFNRVYDPFMTTGYKTSAIVGASLLPEIAFLSTDAPDWTYITDGKDCFWFAEYFKSDLLLNDWFTTVCLNFSGNNEIGKTLDISMDPNGLLQIFFNNNYYAVPKSDSCKFRIFEVGQNGVLDQSAISNVTIDYLNASSTIIGKEPVS